LDSIYLFLYPYSCFARASIGYQQALESDKLMRLGDIIQARYRSRGCGIVWARFRDDEPVRSWRLLDGKYEQQLTIAPFIPTFPSDGVVRTDISFADLCASEPPRYASTELLLGALPPHRTLVVGGFHQHDCVDKIAAASHQGGVKTFVDEDTTEFFFSRSMGETIPLIREKWSLQELGLDDRGGNNVRFREHRPWFTQT
jgi:hypothetical protein